MPVLIAKTGIRTAIEQQSYDFQVTSPRSYVYRSGSMSHRTLIYVNSFSKHQPNAIVVTVKDGEAKGSFSHRHRVHRRPVPNR